MSRTVALTLAVLASWAALASQIRAEPLDLGLPRELDPSKFELFWFDDFDKFDLSADGFGRHKWFNGLWYSKPAPLDLFSHSDGILRLATRANKGALISTLSPKVGGHETAFSYGYFEARLALSANAANWPAFWLFSRDHARGTDGNHWCEIDIFELFASKFAGTVHEWIDFKNKQNRNNLVTLPQGTDLSQWHTYGMTWEPGKVTWYFDKKELMSAATPKICDSQELFLILNANTHDPAVEQFLSVDWIAVFRWKP
ncbi:glycoside hydrolase family 16 protein [Bradyrhizobium liaoningense]|uniref:glycoside hydrolase family 16 protein n=1 Tax=Bradyrhizobium liaoningense TaxID=43992 RepID=UPI001BA7340E|nr:family 16 glycosylhydrolase [Bradyrhizobium liaoningense]MBR0987615.1 family 16 glycosylhydrolase [Bradyrhizobium liaoningense]